MRGFLARLRLSGFHGFLLNLKILRPGSGWNGLTPTRFFPVERARAWSEMAHLPHPLFVYAVLP